MKKLTALMMSLLMRLCAACTPKEQLTVNVAAMKRPHPHRHGPAQFPCGGGQDRVQLFHNLREQPR